MNCDYRLLLLFSHSDVFLELSGFFCDLVDVGNLISGSSAFSKFSLYIWKFSAHVPLKPSLENFKHCLASMWNECGSLSILWHCPSLGLEWKLTFSHPVATAEFSKLAGIWSVVLSHFLCLLLLPLPSFSLSSSFRLFFMAKPSKDTSAIVCVSSPQD